MPRKSKLEAAKERKRAYLRAYYARRYATDPEYRARMQAHSRKKLAEIRTNPKRYAAYKKKMREYFRTLPNRKLSQQRAYASSPPIQNGVNGTMRNNARGIAMIRRSGQEDALEQKMEGSS